MVEANCLELRHMSRQRHGYCAGLNGFILYFTKPRSCSRLDVAKIMRTNQMEDILDTRFAMNIFFLSNSTFKSMDLDLALFLCGNKKNPYINYTRREGNYCSAIWHIDLNYRIHKNGKRSWCYLSLQHFS